jgi:regulatory protein
MAERRTERAAAPLTPERLERAALAYLERYANSAAGLARVLQRRLSKAERQGRAAAGAADIEAVIAKLRRAGLLDDGLFAEGRAGRLARQGRSQRSIARRLAAAGLGEAEIARGLAAAGAAPADELARAVAFARRRRLGPFRAPRERAVRKLRDMAALARQGFAYDLVRRVIEAPDAAALDRLRQEWAEQ